MTTLTIMRMLPREVDPMVFNMTLEDPGQVSFAGIGGLSEQIRELREVTTMRELELMSLIGYRTAFEKSRVVYASWNQASKGSLALWASWDRENIVGTSCRIITRYKLPQS